MGKKKIRSAATSKGERRNCVAGVKEVRRDRSPLEKAANILKAWRAGKNPWVTVPGPSSNKRFIRVRANEHYGNPKKSTYVIFKDKSDE